jgi:cell division septation protein DedD
MHRDDGLVRARSVTFGLAGISVAGVLAVAGMAHAETTSHRNSTPAPATTNTPREATRSPAGGHATTQPKSTPRPQPTKTKHHATSGGS